MADIRSGGRLDQSGSYSGDAHRIGPGAGSAAFARLRCRSCSRTTNQSDPYSRAAQSSCHRLELFLVNTARWTGVSFLRRNLQSHHDCRLCLRQGRQSSARASGGASQRFQYDAANRLVKVKADDNQTVIATYTYGDSNERLIADEGGLRTYYACGASMEYVESGSSITPQWSKTYIYLGARLLSTLTPNGSGGEAVQHHHPDRLGTRLVTDPSSGTSFEQV